MATQIFGRDHVIPTRRTVGKAEESAEPLGSAMRGLLFALMFNLLLGLTGTAIWQLWKLLR